MLFRDEVLIEIAEAGEGDANHGAVSLPEPDKPPLVANERRFDVVLAGVKYKPDRERTIRPRPTVPGG